MLCFYCKICQIVAVQGLKIIIICEELGLC